MVVIMGAGDVTLVASELAVALAERLPARRLS
jgi:hypothetical protein